MPLGVTARTFDSAAAVGRKYLGLSVVDVMSLNALLAKVGVNESRNDALWILDRFSLLEGKKTWAKRL